MSFKFLLGIVIYCTVCASIFVTPQAAIGTAIVAVTVLSLAYLTAAGNKNGSARAFWSGILGLAWFVVILGFNWEVQADPPQVIAGVSPQPVVRSYQQLISVIYLPITRTVSTKGAIIEFRTIFHGKSKNYLQRQIPSMANYSRFLTSLSAWFVAGCTAAFINWRTGKRKVTTTSRDTSSEHAGVE